MPVRHVGGGCYRWGDRGKIYCGRGAKQKAERQGRAAYSHGYRGKEPTHERTTSMILPLALGLVAAAGIGYVIYAKLHEETDLSGKQIQMGIPPAGSTWRFKIKTSRPLSASEKDGAKRALTAQMSSLGNTVSGLTFPTDDTATFVVRYDKQPEYPVIVGAVMEVAPGLSFVVESVEQVPSGTLQGGFFFP